jgi:hypothetical protein
MAHLRDFFIVISAAIISSSLSAATLTVDLRPKQDSFVSTEDESGNHGSATTLYAGFLSDPKLGQITFRTLIEFDVEGSLPPGAELESASLLLYQSTAVPGGASATMLAYVFPLAEPWDEAKVTWGDQPAIFTAPSAKTAPGVANGIKTWDVTSIVEEWLSGAKPNCGFALRSADEKTVAGWGFQSREAAAASRPILRLSYREPLPPLRGNRAIDSAEVVLASGGCALHVAWHGETGAAFAPGAIADLSCELAVKVNGAPLGAAAEALYLFPSGTGTGPACPASSPCGGDCKGLWVFPGGEGAGACDVPPDASFAGCVCRSPTVLAAIPLPEAPREGDAIEVLLVPKALGGCPPFCPPGPSPDPLPDEFAPDDRFAFVHHVKEPSPTAFRRGDANNDERVNLSDSIQILLHLFGYGRTPSCRKAADVNDDGGVDLSDAIAIIFRLFGGAGPFPEPYTKCGPDPTPDALDCDAFAGCASRPEIIRSIEIDQSVICPGQSVRVSVLAEDPDRTAGPVDVTIHGKPGSVQSLQFSGDPGLRRIPITATTREGYLETRTVTIRVASCGAFWLPVVRIRASPFHPRMVDLAVTNAGDLPPGPASYTWDFGDGQGAVTAVPHASHRYDPLGFPRDARSAVFHASVRVQPPGGAPVSATFTVSVINTYQLNRERGYLRPPAESEGTLERFGPDLVGRFTITNLEDETIIFATRTIEGQPCDPGKDPVVLTALPRDVSIDLLPRDRRDLVLVLPAGSVPPDICALSVLLEGQASSGAPVSTALYFTVQPNPFLLEPERDYDVLLALAEVTSRGLVADPDHIADEEFDRLAMESKIEFPLRGRVQVGGGEEGSGEIGDECTPGEALREGLTCQATGEWRTLRGFVANARKGELILVRSCNAVGTMLQAVGQTYSHVGIMTRHNTQIAHSTISDVRILDHPFGGGDPTDGIVEAVLKYAWPGAVVQSADDAFRGQWMPDSGGHDYRIHSFNWMPGDCRVDGALVFPQVLKPPPDREEELTPLLHAAADAALDIQAGGGTHYRFFSYTDGSIAAEDAFDGPEAGLLDATCCSTFIWEACRRAGIEMEGTPEEGEPVDPSTSDGLYFYDEEVRRNAADVMYDEIYDMVYDAGGWLGLVVDAPDDLASQICNCFASDDCSHDACNSTAWQDPGPGRTVSPDDLRRWDLYGPSDDLIFRETQWIRIYRVGRSAGTGRITGRVLDRAGALVPGALVELTSMPDVAAVHTDNAGAFAFDAIPAGSHALRATKLIGGLLHETCPDGPESDAEECRPVLVEPAVTSSRDLRLEPPGRSRRLVTISGFGHIRDDEDPFRDVVRDRDIFEPVHLDPENDGATVDIVPRCVGGEVRFVMTLSLNLQDDLSVRVTGAAFLYETDDCAMSDLEDMVDIGVDVPEDGPPAVIHVFLENSGAGGGDTADFNITITNTRA